MEGNDIKHIAFDTGYFLAAQVLIHWNVSSLDPEVGKRLVASSMEFQVHKVTTPSSGYHVLCSVPPGTKIGDVHVTCGNACIIIEHGKNKKQEVSWNIRDSPWNAELPHFGMAMFGIWHHFKKINMTNCFLTSCAVCCWLLWYRPGNLATHWTDWSFCCQRPSSRPAPQQSSHKQANSRSSHHYLEWFVLSKSRVRHTLIWVYFLEARISQLSESFLCMSNRQ